MPLPQGVTVKSRNFRSMDSAMEFARSIVGDEIESVSASPKRPETLFFTGFSEADDAIIERACQAFGLDRMDVEDFVLYLVPTKSGRWSIEIEACSVWLIAQ